MSGNFSGWLDPPFINRGWGGMVRTLPRDIYQQQAAKFCACHHARYYAHKEQDQLPKIIEIFQPKVLGLNSPPSPPPSPSPSPSPSSSFDYWHILHYVTSYHTTKLIMLVRIPLRRECQFSHSHKEINIS